MTLVNYSISVKSQFYCQLVKNYKIGGFSKKKIESVQDRTITIGLSHL